MRLTDRRFNALTDWCRQHALIVDPPRRNPGSCRQSTEALWTLVVAHQRYAQAAMVMVAEHPTAEEWECVAWYIAKCDNSALCTLYMPDFRWCRT